MPCSPWTQQLSKGFCCHSPVCSGAVPSSNALEQQLAQLLETVSGRSFTTSPAHRPSASDLIFVLSHCENANASKEFQVQVLWNEEVLPRLIHRELEL